MHHAKALCALTAPSVNSYKRLGARNPRSGATWAPIYIAQGGNNRTVMVRVPAPGRIEYRTSDGSSNPYLAATAVLAAGLDGIARGWTPEKVTTKTCFSYLHKMPKRAALKHSSKLRRSAR
jgi:glutamine synthetase